MKKALFILIAIFSVSFSSCEKEDTEPEIEKADPIEEIIGMYDAKRHQSYTVGGTTQVFDEVLEIRKDGNDFAFYVDGYWNSTLKFKRFYDEILYWSESNSTFERKGWFTTLANYTSSEVTFQMNKNNKLEVCMKYYDIKNATTNDPLGYDIIVFYVGNRR